MTTDKHEEFWRRAAAGYAEQYGAELRLELTELERDETPILTPRLDQRVRQMVGAEKRARQNRWIGLMAAGLALAVIVPGILRMNEQRSSAPQAMPEAVMDEAAAAPEEETMEDAAAPDMAAGEVQESPPAQAFQAEPEVIPLGFSLPQNFSVAAVEQDQGKSVYTLMNSQLDDVVLTLERPGPEISFEGLVEIGINGHATYGRSTPDFNLLTFQRQDIVYTLTCRHDINTLVNLSENILQDL